MAYQKLELNTFKDQSVTDERFLTLIAKLPPLSPKGPWLAGGSVRKYMNGLQNHADYDIFFVSQEQCDQYCELLLNAGATEKSQNIYNRTFDLDGFEVQCIYHEFCSTLIKTLDRFDMTICQFGYDGTHLVWSDEAGEDAREMKFRFINLADLTYSMNRAFKFASEGYRPRDGEIKRVLNRVVKDPSVLNNNKQISGQVNEPKVVTNTVSGNIAGPSSSLVNDILAGMIGPFKSINQQSRRYVASP